LKLANENKHQSTVKSITIKNVATQHLAKTDAFKSEVNEMTEDILSSINPHDLDGLVI